MRPLIIVSILAFVVGCATKREVVAPERFAHAKVTLVYQSNRWGIIEPCGCESKPYGGIDREANAISWWRTAGESILYADAGNLFAPPKPKARIEHYQKRAEAIAEMLNRTGLQVFAPGPSDFALGPSFLRSLSKKTKFKWVSTNVRGNDGETLFPPYLIEERRGIRFGILGLTPRTPPGENTVTIDEPFEALERWLPRVKRESDIIVILSQLGTPTDEKLANKFTSVHIIVGADPEFSIEEPFWFAGRTLVVDPHTNGYLLGKLNVDLRLPFRGFYSPLVVGKNRRAMRQWEADLARDPTNSLAKKEMTRIMEAESLFPIDGGSVYSHELVELDEKRFGAKNVVASLMRRERERIRREALAEQSQR